MLSTDILKFALDSQPNFAYRRVRTVIKHTISENLLAIGNKLLAASIGVGIEFALKSEKLKNTLIVPKSMGFLTISL
jgi:hypothetical protein